MAETMTLDVLAGQIRALLETHPGNTPVYLMANGYALRAIKFVCLRRVSKKKPAELVARGGIDAVVIR